MDSKIGHVYKDYEEPVASDCERDEIPVNCIADLLEGANEDN